ncbi:MAG TPA: helix-turn-helix transcriptional regulator [Clostridia bacterium]|nr:helix-turn-helix transcriptional regulator [Clostridia bacterium]
MERLKNLLSESKIKPGADKRFPAETPVSAVHTPYGEKLSISDEEKSLFMDLLTPRERDTCLLLLEGYTLKETAKRLGIGYSTANTYQTALYRKLHINTRAELIINYRDIGRSQDRET